MSYDYILNDKKRYPRPEGIDSISYELPEERRNYYVFEIRETSGMINHTQVLKRDQAFVVDLDLAVRSQRGDISGYILAFKSNDLDLINRERDLLISDYSLINKEIEKTEKKDKRIRQIKKFLKYLFVCYIVYIIFK